MTTDAENIVGLYRRHAETWTALRGRGLMERQWLDRFLELLPGEPDVLDIGCGSGEPIARYLLERGCAVTGIDAAPEMTALAKARFPAAEWQVADMRTLDLAKRFAGLLAWDSFFHLTPADQRLMFPLFGNHAAWGAALMFTSGWSHGETVGRFEGEPLYHASLDPSEYRSLLGNNGFEVVDHKVRDPDCGERTIWLARRLGPDT